MRNCVHDKTVAWARPVRTIDSVDQLLGITANSRRRDAIQGVEAFHSRFFEPCPSSASSGLLRFSHAFPAWRSKGRRFVLFAKPATHTASFLPRHHTLLAVCTSTMPSTQPKSTGKPAARPRPRYSLDADPKTRKIETVADKFFQMSCANFNYLTTVQRGFYEENLDKKNQDAFCVHEQLCDAKEGAFFGVFDGHGKDGDKVANFCAEELPKKVAEKFAELGDNPSDDAMKEMFEDSFKETDQSLREKKDIDSDYSGTTAAVAIVDKGGKRIVVANAGDSRIVLGYEVEDPEGGELYYEVEQITKDHKPEVPKERQRIQATGLARVVTALKSQFCLTGGKEEDYESPEAEDDEPLRVYTKAWGGPGCAFSRSLGDHAAESLGIISTPDVYFVDLTKLPFEKVISILMLEVTDGISDHFDNQDLVDAVQEKKNSPGAHGKPLQHAGSAVVQHAGQASARLFGCEDDKTIQMVEIVLANNCNIQAKTDKSGLSPKKMGKGITSRLFSPLAVGQEEENDDDDDDDDGGALDNEQDTVSVEGSPDKKLPPPRTPFAKAVPDGHPTEGTTPTLSPKGQTILNQSAAMFEAVSAVKISASALKTQAEAQLIHAENSRMMVTMLSEKTIDAGPTPNSKASGAASGADTASKPSGAGTASKRVRAKKIPTIIDPFSQEVNVRILKGDYRGWNGLYLRREGGYHYIGVHDKQANQFYETRKKHNDADPSYEELKKTD